MLEKSSVFALVALFTWACSDAGSSAVGSAGAGEGTSLASAGTSGISGAGGVASAGASAASGGAGGGSATLAWLPSWATTIQRTEIANLPPALPNNTLRQFVWPTVSGQEIRIQLSNEKGSTPLEIQQAHVARALTQADPGNSAGQIDTATDASFTFSGMASVTIPAGASVWSDPLAFSLQELQLTAITLQLGNGVPVEITGHPGSRTTSYVASGDAVALQGLAGAETRDRWYFIDAIEVMAPADAYAIAVLGDSITDGYGVLNQFARWPDFMTLAIQNDPTIADNRSVLDFGMGANNLTVSGEFQDSGLVRFERDVLGRDKIKWLIVLEGINDIVYSNVQAQPIIDAYSQIIQRAHAKGILVYGSPITPNGDAGVRAQVNNWIRTSGQFDVVIDFETAIADPNNPNSILPMLNNDNLHPNTAGYQTMGNTVDLSLFYQTMGN
jgi:lysophospholipase L1-like esterase